MKIVDKIISIIFSFIMLIISITSIFLCLGWLELSVANEIVETIILNDISSKTIMIVSIIFIALAIKVIFFGSVAKAKEEFKSGVLLENGDGKLLISKDTIENLVDNVIKGFDSAVDTQIKVILDQENNITINVTLLVKETAVIKELSTNIQTRIKETIKRATDLDVKQINIKVKNIENIKEKNIQQ